MAAYLRQSSLFLRTPTEGGGCEPSNSCIRKDFLGVRNEWIDGEMIRFDSDFQIARMILQNIFKIALLAFFSLSIE
jgi:hypothetical protein